MAQLSLIQAIEEIMSKHIKNPLSLHIRREGVYSYYLDPSIRGGYRHIEDMALKHIGNQADRMLAIFDDLEQLELQRSKQHDYQEQRYRLLSQATPLLAKRHLEMEEVDKQDREEEYDR